MAVFFSSKISLVNNFCVESSCYFASITIQLVDPVGSDAGDISDVAGEREKPPKCGSLPRDAGDLAGLHICKKNLIKLI